MSPDHDIHQGKFESEFHKCAVNILITSNWLYAKNALRLKPFGITPEQFNVLRILRGSHPNTLMLAEIARRMIHKSSNATRLVEKLRLKGLVDRKVCEGNRRQVDIKITAKGLGLLEEIDKDSNGWTASLKNISKEEAKELSRILTKLRGW